MGQYYTPIILSANGGKTVGSFYSHDYDNGLKLMEHSYLGNDLVDSVVAKAMSVMKPVTIAWLGDYAELNEDVLPLAEHRAFDPANNVGKVHRDYVRMFDRLKRVEAGGLYLIKPTDEDVSKRLTYAGNVVFYDFLTRQKLSLRKYRKNVIASRESSGFDPEKLGYGVDELIVHPLPLLTSIGNGKGGGDYSGTCMGWVGAWALHPIGVVYDSGFPEPEGEWEDVSEKVRFEEGREWVRI